MGWCADSGIDDDWNDGLCDDDGDLFTSRDAFVRTDRRTEWHDRGATAFLETFGEDRIGVDVGKNGETFFDKNFSSFERLDGIGEEVGGIGMNFEFDPFWEASGMSEASEANCFFGVHGSTGVGEQEVFFWVDEIEDIGEGIFFSR